MRESEEKEQRRQRIHLLLQRCSHSQKRSTWQKKGGCRKPMPKSKLIRKKELEIIRVLLQIYLKKKKKCEEKQRSLLRVAWEINRRRSKQLSERLKLCKEKKKKKELIFKVSKILLRRKMNQGCLPGLLSLKGCKISGLVLPQDYRSRTKWYGVNSLWRLRERSSRMIFELLT